MRSSHRSWWLIGLCLGLLAPSGKAVAACNPSPGTVNRIPSLAPGYCYGKRIMYADKQYYGAVAEDVYDTNMKLWKVVWTASAPANLDTYGPQVGFGSVVETYWDVQNDHVSYITGCNPAGVPELWDRQVPVQVQQRD